VEADSVVRKSVFLHNRLKLPFFVIGIVIFGVLVAEGIYVVLNVSLLALSVLAIAVILSGRNPWWVRSRLDQRGTAKKARLPEGTNRPPE